MLRKNLDIKLSLIYWFSIFLYLVSTLLWLFYDPTQLSYQYNFHLKFTKLFIYFGIDGLSLFFIYLTTMIIPLCFLFLLNTKKRTLLDSFFVLILVEVLLILCFSVLDLFFFYILFESILLPFFIYIGILGYQSRRIHASYLLFFYTISGSLLMFFSIVYLYIFYGTTDLQVLIMKTKNDFNSFLWIGFFLTFAIKIPMFPFHIWLPEAHVEAPTEGSVLLAGLLLKLGTYGFLRYLFNLFPEETIYFSPIVIVLSTIGVFYSSYTTLRQIDIKRIIAYSSVSHMNMCVLGLFSFQIFGICGSVILMIGHGLVSSALFFLVGVIYKIYGTKNIKYYSGLIYKMPAFSFFFLFFLVSNTSFPTTSNFIGEFLIILNLLMMNNYILMFSIFIAIMMTSIYCFWLLNKIVFTLPIYKKGYKDLTYIDVYLFTVFLIFVFWLGIYPTSYIDILLGSLNYHLVI